MNYKIDNFKINTDLTFYIEIRDKDNEYVVIDEDELWFILKSDPDNDDEEAILISQGDLASQGASGIGYFHLTKAELNIDPGLYFFEFKWLRSNGEKKYFPKDRPGKVNALKAVWDHD